EFSVITDETIIAERKRYRTEIISTLESFSKRAAVRNLKFSGNFTKDQLGAIYDLLFKAIWEVPPSGAGVSGSVDATGRPETRISMNTFKSFLSYVASWARDEAVVSNGFQQRIQRTVVDHDLIHRLFYRWDFSSKGALSLQDIVTGLNGVMFNDLMANIEWFFSLHDKDKDGSLTKDELLQLSESLLFIFRNEPGDAYLGAVSRFMTNAFEYGDSLLEEKAKAEEDDLQSNTEGVNMLADEILESFFDTDLSASFSLDEPGAPLPDEPSGLLGGLVSSIMTDENKRLFNRVADEIGKTMGKHHVDQRPSIGKLGKEMALQEPKLREPLVVQRKSTASSDTLPLQPTPSLDIQNEKQQSDDVAPPQQSKQAELPTPLIPVPMIMERQKFAIDEAKDDGEEEDMYAIGGDEDVLDEVDAFLEAHDSGLTEAQKAEAQGLLSASPLK
ncbi:hypothetical protein FRB99_004126, partial [Tulasnella sp. 403]